MKGDVSSTMAVSKTETKFVYDFEEGNAGMKYVLGGKGANLAEMTRLELPVPQGFTIVTKASVLWNDGQKLPENIYTEINDHLDRLEGKTGKQLGAADDPLLVSVRSGAAFSMPGMMDTILNLGLNDESVKGLAKLTQDERFAYDSYRRFVQMFGKVVLEMDGQIFEDAIKKKKEEKNVEQDTDLTAEDLKALVEDFKKLIKDATAEEFPNDPRQQLDYSIKAVFRSWNNKRAVDYRRLYKIEDELGTAVNVQAMVFGNKGDSSATGVAFTRNPATGENEIYGDYLTNAQGEDVVAGIRHTKPLADLGKEMPEVYKQLLDIMEKLDNHYRDMNDIEFTIEQGKLYMLQTRIGKRTAAAALRIAFEMEKEGLIDKKTAVSRIEPDQFDQLLHPQFDPKAKYDVLGKGLNASPGAAVGEVVLDADKAEELGKDGRNVILTRWETTPDDLHGMIAAQGILTSHGGKTSHAAVVARGMGKPAVTGAQALKIDIKKRTVSVNNTTIKEGDIISIDGTTGAIVKGKVALKPPTPTDEFNTILGWADEIRTLGVRTNADTPEDAAKAREFGAEGIGLARTEHMFLGDRLPIVQNMILSESEKETNEALEALLKVQKKDFFEIFKVMDTLPVTIRLLDPPLHEFLPNLTDLKVEIAKMETQGKSGTKLDEKRKIASRVESMVESNPMLGLRGCRLGIVHPDLYRMQVRAIIEAALEWKKQGGKPIVEIMIPLVSVEKELALLRAQSEEVIKEVFDAQSDSIEYKIGTMIEVPRAAVTSDEIAKQADFFSFGTNDLTQLTYAYSRDDVEGKFLVKYLEQKILARNPFETVDQKGVGRLIEMSVDLGRKTNPDIKLGICGEHGGEAESVMFFHKVGLDYVSASPYRIPLARLAAAQAVIAEEGGEASTSK